MSNHRSLFKPSSSQGWLLLLTIVLITLLVAGIMIFVTIKAPDGNTSIVIMGLVTAAVCVVIGAVFTVYVAIYPTMQYEFSDDSLLLKCGWFKKAVPYTEISDISVKDIKVNLSSQAKGFIKFPGYALGKTAYMDEGIVFMFATRVNRRIFVIRMKNGEKIGVTPELENEFLNRLEEMRKIRRV